MNGPQKAVADHDGTIRSIALTSRETSMTIHEWLHRMRGELGNQLVDEPKPTNGEIEPGSLTNIVLDTLQRLQACCVEMEELEKVLGINPLGRPRT